MANKKIEKLDALIFIDTNIFLDFYRIRNSNVSLKYLEQIVKYKDLIISTNQIEMEFKKNRQEVILETMSEVKKINNINVNNIPPILSDDKAVDMIKKSKKIIESQQNKLKQRIERILKTPSVNDPVFKSLQKIFKHNSIINLNRENKIRYTIRRLAMKRFILGYPPRKKTDNSIGDAINWEWIIHCAEKTGKNIILVTRDTDYGKIYGEESYLDDWLYKEFKERTSQKRKLILTDKLGFAFKLVEIPVTQEMIDEEKNVINTTSDIYVYPDFPKRLKELQEISYSPVMREAMNRFQENMNGSLLQRTLFELIKQLNISNK
ncbi:MAG: PIN domain-containing protein [Tenuifilaceae bacterium]